MAQVNSSNIFAELSMEETDQSIPERFEKQVRRYPNNIAIKTGDEQFTYSDLNTLANQLARVVLHELRDNKPIAVLMEHGARAVIAILAALKASKVFLCLDPALPDTRIDQILTDSGADSLITDNQHFKTAVDSTAGRRRIINMDHCDRPIDSNNLDLRISPDSIAYVLYTSGSTGKPKGVIRTHRIDLRNIRHVTNTLRITHEDRITLLGSYSTGQGMTDIFCALLNGATLFPRNLKTEGFNGLAEWLIHEKITFYHSAVTVFRHFTHCLRGGEIFPDLRIIRLGAESVSWKDVEAYKKYFSDSCLLANELSCSEASTYSQFLIDKQTEIKEFVPVGYPVEGKEILILDEYGNQLGPGELGEIAVRSRSLSPGYWNSPDLTIMSFHQDTDDPEYWVYQTGDLGRKSSDGCLQHLGRKDGQVQIRGHRVECREIELALLHDPMVEQAFVTHGQDPREGNYLIAYVVCGEGIDATVSELRANLARRLPNFMIPAAFIFLDSLPLTATGKIDRAALPKPTSTRPALEECYVSPETAVEKSIAGICSEILHISTIGINDNFFDLGGHSLSAMQIVDRVTREFHVDVPLKSFYDCPTIAGLSAIVGSRRDVAESEAVLSRDSIEVRSLAERNRPILPSIAQEQMLRLERLFPGFHQFNVSTAYRLRGPLDLVALKQGIMRLSDRHESLRTVFCDKDGQHHQEIRESTTNNFVLIDLQDFPAAQRESKVKELFRKESQRSFDLAHGPLFRVTVFRLSDEDHILAITLHQLVTDAWSMGIFLRDLAELYRSSLQGNRSQLPDLPIQYADYAIWQREALRAGLMDSQIEYWKSQLGEPLSRLELSSAAIRRGETHFFTARKEISISGELYQSIKSLARELRTTPYVVLLTTLKILLSRYLKQDDIRVATLVANRHRSEVQNLIGHLVNTIVLRAKISAALRFKELGQLIKNITVNAYANQDVPFEVLLQSMEKDSTIKRDMLAPVLFIFQGEPDAIILPNLTLSPLDDFQRTPTPEVNLSEFDMVLSIKESGGGFAGFMLYKIFILNETTVSEFVIDFKDLLSRIVDNPDQSVSDLRSYV